MKLLKNRYSIFTLFVITLYNLIFFFNDSIILYSILLSIFLFLISRVSIQSQNLLLHSFYFVNLLNLVIPAKPVFSGNQFTYFDEQFVELILFNSDVYSDHIMYIGFTYLSKLLLISGNLESLNVFLFFLNIATFYGIFLFYKSVARKEKNIYFFSVLLFILFVAVNLPSNFNSLMGIPKLFLNGTAGFGSFGIRVFTPASFDLLMFYPLVFLCRNKLWIAIFSGCIISLFHYYLFVILSILIFSYFISRLKTNLSFYFFLVLTIPALYLISNLDYFIKLSQIFSLIKPTSVNFNLVEFLSLGTIINNGTNSDFIYYLDFKNFSIFKPNYLFSNFSPTLGVINNESSIPIEKIVLFLLGLRYSLQLENKFTNSFIFCSLNIYIISHFLYSNNYLNYLGIIYPWRITHLLSIVCFVILFLRIPSINLNLNFSFSLLLLLLLPLSNFLWNIYDKTPYSYNESLKNTIEETVQQEDELIIIPLLQTKYLYHYGLPNVPLFLYPPFDLNNLDKTLDYFETYDTYNELIDAESCDKFQFNFDELNIDATKIFLPESSNLFGKNCDNKIIFYED